MYTLDGSHGEGGGSILRLATALSLITQEPIKIVNIRKKRPTPGLKTQHLMGLNALSDFCGGKIDGGHLGSETITFYPSNNWKDHLKISVSTAGSLGLILQTLQLAVLAKKSYTLKIDFNGGATFGKWAPSLPYINHVTWEIFRRMGCDFNLRVERHGFYPKGGAKVSTNLTTPSVLNGLKLEIFQKPNSATIYSFASNHLKESRVAERQTITIEKGLKNENIKAVIQNEYVETNNPGSGILIFSKTEDSIIGGDFVGERGIRAEDVGRKAFERYKQTIDSSSTIDPFLADQILPAMALTSKFSSFTTPYLSNHTMTNIKLLTELLDVNISTEKLKTNFKLSING